jgi:hypothetical protein
MKKTVDEILKDVKQILDASKERSIKKFKPLTVKERDENLIYACLQLFQDFSLNYNLYYLGQDQGENILDIKYAPLDENDPVFLPELDAYIGNLVSTQELTEAEDAAFSTALYDDYLFHFLSECWASAGGDHTKIPTYFCFDKEFMCRDFKTGEIIEEVEAARRVGYTVVR